MNKSENPGARLSWFPTTLLTTCLNNLRQVDFCASTSSSPTREQRIRRDTMRKQECMLQFVKLKKKKKSVNDSKSNCKHHMQSSLSAHSSQILTNLLTFPTFYLVSPSIYKDNYNCFNYFSNINLLYLHSTSTLINHNQLSSERDEKFPLQSIHRGLGREHQLALPSKPRSLQPFFFYTTIKHIKHVFSALEQYRSLG